MKTYCLSGFGETLDWRPIVLLEPPPKELLCVFCNVVSATPSPLPCGHQACRVCRSEVLLRGNVCPFDKNRKKRLHGAVAVSRVEARCFNFPFGCPFTGTLRELELHFPDGCNHHKDVLQRLLAEHIFSGCVEHVPLVPPASSVENGDSSASQRRLSALEKIIEERFRALLVLSGSGTLYISQYWRKDEAKGVEDGSNSNDDGSLRLGEHYLKLAYTYSKKRNGDVVLLFQILLREGDDQERPKNGRRSPEQETKAEPLLDGTLALSLCRAGSSEEHPLPTYALPEGAPEGDGWSVVACTTKVDWQVVEQRLDADRLHFCVRLE
ncbi:hypothetical protein HPB48_008484 [Haemaphysalis longicornis]|uniref:RING-type domain-containing protein n=1 Tax=Haemaphysalis longicornis TaxID=44386 RepID=A0A9J6FDN2_HAELO|nr:hypothetical protein HPB48_008484 [Haemaphysalis longicornis]